MNKRTIGIIAVAVSCLIAVAVMTAYFLLPRDESAQTMADDNNKSSASTNNGESEMYKMYVALKGEAYDKDYLADMIVHHEGAMNMSEMAIASAGRQEIKDLAASINASQGPEVARMVDLQQKWGYPKTSGHMMTAAGEHAMNNMAMDGEALKGLSGDAFDKKFLELMIQHHQDAIDMSRPAATNSNREEIKDMAQTIITAQTKEIVQMQLWQKQWGYK